LLVPKAAVRVENGNHAYGSTGSRRSSRRPDGWNHGDRIEVIAGLPLASGDRRRAWLTSGASRFERSRA
jgi:hypothetical protein